MVSDTPVSMPSKIYDRHIKKVEKSLGTSTTLGGQLAKYGHDKLGRNFKGVYTIDTIPKLKHKQMAIVNLDKAGQPGSHWVSIYKHGRDTWVYDSFGRNIKNLLGNGYRSGMHTTNRNHKQPKKDKNCGQRCVAVLEMHKKFGPKEVSKFI